MLKRKKMSKNKKSLISVTVMLSVFLLSIVATTVAVLAGQTQLITSSVAISYVSKEVSGDMKLTAYSADGTTSQVLTHSNEQGTDDGYINFDVQTQAVIDQLNNSLNTLTTTKNYIVIECEFTNRGSRTIEVTLNQALTSSNNVALKYLYTGFTKLSTSQFSSINSVSLSGQSLENANAQSVAVAGTNRPVYFYVKIGVENLANNADYNAIQNWFFSGDDATIGDSLKTINVVGGPTATITAIEGLNLPAMNTDKSNYIFAGYYTEQEGGIQYIDANGNPTRALDTTELTNNTLYARYTYALNVTGTTISLASGIDKTKLQSLVVPSGVTELGYNSFKDCTALESVVISEGVTRIGDHSFSGCTNLTSVVIPEGVTRLGNAAFYGCTNLSSIEIPASVTTIASSCFRNCGSLTTVNIGEDSELETVATYSFGSTGLTSITIPAGVTTIGESAFYGCRSLETVIFEDGSLLESFGTSTFENCGNLVNIAIPEGVTSIGSRAFAATGLVNIHIPDGVTEIGYTTFRWCNYLETVTFGINSQLEKLGSCSLGQCPKLKEIIIPRNVNYIGQAAINTTANGRVVYYQGSASDWQNITIESTDNTYLTLATYYYYSATQPQSVGNYWHYDTDGVTPVIWQ